MSLTARAFQKLSTIALLLALALPTLARGKTFRADFNGDYATAGATISNLQGTILPCDPLTLKVEQSRVHLRLVLSELVCKNVKAEAYDVRFDLGGDRVRLEGLLVGDFRADVFRVDFPISSNIILTILLKMEADGSVRYLERSSSRNAAQVVDAPFKKVK